MASHLQLTVATDMPVFFCDPHSPWQRGSNENTVSLEMPRRAGSAGWCRQLEVTPENTGRLRCALRLTCSSGCRHRPGPLVLA